MNIQRYDIRTSSRRVLRRCLRKWGFTSSMKMNLQRRGSETNIHFWFGTAIHFAMEDYFGWNKFGDPRRAFKAYVQAFSESEKPDGADLHYELGLAMLTYFLEWYPSHNSDMQFKTVWLDSQNRETVEFAPDARPLVEEKFLLDLNTWAIMDVNTHSIIRKWEPTKDIFRQGNRIDTLLSPELVRSLGPDETYEWITGGAVNNVFGIPEEEVKTVRLIPVAYHGTMDRIVKDRWGRWWVLDYKTAKGADTRKLDTDDQISAYLWAAEQHFQHQLYGFVYLQLTKDVAKPPKRLKSGALSVDKKQRTTYQLYKEEVLRDYSEVKKAPSAIIDMLNTLAELETAEGDRFIRWDYVLRSDAQKISTYNHIMAEVNLMLSPDLYLFPNPTRDCGWDCPYREACIAMDMGEEDNAMSIIDSEFEVRPSVTEHDTEDWVKKIVWPTTHQEAAKIDDLDLCPKNIFNLELPAEYYSTTYEED